jgi:tetratricopeptide (TPR) repeat protein
VDVDSTFVMAWHRLSDAYGWMENINSEVGGRASERVMALAESLPLRERSLMVAAERALDEGDLSAYADLREAVSKYPDDPEAWFTLGEFYRHVGVPAGLATSEDEVDAIRRAVDLDPTFAPYYIHYIEGLVGAGNEAAAREALATYRSLAPTNANGHLALAVSLFLGEAEERRATLDGLDAVPADHLMRVWREVPWSGLDAPEETLEVYRAAYRVSGATYWLTGVSELLLALGRTGDAVAGLADPSVPPFARVQAAGMFLHLGVPVPEGLAGALDDLDVCPDREDAGLVCMFTVGSVAALAGDRDTWRHWVERNRALGVRYEEEGQGAHAKEHEAIARALEGLWTLRQEGDKATARGALEESVMRLGGEAGYMTRWHLVSLVEEELPRDALRLLEGMVSGVYEGYARVRVGRLRERIGDASGAREAYQRAVRIFQDADADHAYALEARESLARLGA